MELKTGNVRIIELSGATGSKVKICKQKQKLTCSFTHRF